ncbi:MAG: DNA-processing protein DprA [Nitrospiraceae bacterium]|nr:MAG: DNA-processing protein DprA [Nitrospiraceae bacterium]
MSDLQYWIALNFLPDIGPVLSRRLLSAFGSPENIFSMSLKELRQIEGVGKNRALRITQFNGWGRVQREIDLAAKNNIHIVSSACRDYPECLTHIVDAPPVLYMKGRIESADKYAVAMVGSRNSTIYGRQVAGQIGLKLASSGLTVVSGMARGVDTSSHIAALKAGGRTIAVLGSGLDVPYPATNRELMNKIASSGCVISEFPFGTQPLRENFPRRNRIISALSMGVIVVEAALDSGSLITVTYALEQGKDVFAVPGNITSRNSRGTNELIKNGAKLIESADDVISDLKPQLQGALKEDIRIREIECAQLSDDEKSVFRCLSAEPKHIDMIVREEKIAMGKALSILLGLELKGVVSQSEGKLFSLN